MRCPTCDGHGYVYWWPTDDYRVPHRSAWSASPEDGPDVCPECDMRGTTPTLTAEPARWDR